MSVLDRFYNRNVPQLPVPVDLNSLEQQLRAASAVAQYAPRREPDINRAVRTIETFAELPAKALDDLIAEREADLERLKTLAQRMRDAYVQCADDLMAEIERSQAINQFTEEAFKALAAKHASVDAPKDEQTEESVS